MANHLDQMRAFKGVVEAGGFSRATGRTGMSRAAVSRHIGELEDRLGIRLLHRTTRHMSLTEAGEAFYEKCSRILEDIENAERSLTDAATGPQGALRVVAPVNFGLMDLGEAVVAFLREFPLIQLNLSLNDQPVDPMQGGFDIAIRLSRTEPELPKTLDMALLSQSTRILCASPDYLKKNGCPDHPDALRDHQCLSYSYVEDPAIWRLTRDGTENVVPITARVTTSAGRVLTSAAEEGLGIAYGPLAFFRDHLAKGTLTRVLGDYEVPRASIFSLFERSRYVPAKIGAFNNFMERFFDGRIY